MLRNAIWLFALTVIVLVLFLPSYTQMQDLKQKNLDYKNQLVKLKEENRRLKEEQGRLENDPSYLEKVGRDKMGLIKEGEVMYQITPGEQKK